ncbi:nucleotidyltransferase domain-containing protein [Alicyclobacillus fastidiosus]|uniref:Nucleotidyltransferase domain-containing protein n=1 Tax=Alicyclobacillus fastidiosus TaxID=392011 RepID=A0ABY6ZG64_9BACL|nr:nucleotidyltransferase domain-containing protein [Alicyclobacillus fastidiosus]WAH41114.1 nucleotidyltransferase domain-containing protein [Alicyclobacillus fastidiosus]GMA62670.1 nucleotidyltransferase [Alicyclobacillus fastidiosus]
MVTGNARRRLDSALIAVLAGSRAYGTHTPVSDTDYRGVMAATRQMLLGLESWDTQWISKQPDILLYTLPKFVKLALSANPNILDTLFAPDDVIVTITDVGRELRSLRQSFLSKRVYTTFTRYAQGQLRKLQHGTRCEDSTGPDGRCRAHAGIVGSHGYDTKHAMHLVRLYRMGYELLTTGQIQVRRPDAAELLSIRNGAWRLEQFQAFADEMDELCRRALARTDLPDEPDTERIHEWLMDTQLVMLNEGVRSDGNQLDCTEDCR